METAPPFSPVQLRPLFRGMNLLNEEALSHTSFVKNAAPLMGRNLVIAFRAGF